MNILGCIQALNRSSDFLIHYNSEKNMPFLHFDVEKLKPDLRPNNSNVRFVSESFLGINCIQLVYESHSMIH